MGFLFNRARRSTLIALLEMDARRLSDLGLTRHDLIDAMRYAGPAAALLDARRHERATNWLR